MKKAVMYGGGNIGRGFVGALFSQSGYAVTFIDVADQVVNALNAQNRYPIRIVSNQGYTDIEITGVDAIHGRDTDAVARSIAEADIMATAVGVNVLKHIVPNLVAGLRLRFAAGKEPLNIIICENLMHADKYLASLVKASLTQAQQQLFDEKIGLVEASIGRMVPVQTPDMQDGNPLRVCVEPYGFLPVDKSAFKGGIPVIENMIPSAPFDFFIRRKLYIHNLGHAVCAYLGDYNGYKTIAESIDNADILMIVQNAMQESAMALASQYQVPLQDILLHVNDLLSRFTNVALQDTCQRVGSDPGRKLQPDDRLIGSARMCLAQGVTPVHISIGIAGAIYRYLKKKSLNQSLIQAQNVLSEVAGLSEGKDDQLISLVITMYQHFCEEQPVAEMRRLSALIRADIINQAY